MRTVNLGSFVRTLDALEGTGTAAWGWDVEADVIYWSMNTGPLFGRERGYAPSSYQEFLALIHEEDRAVVEAAVGEALVEGTDYEFDIRAVMGDGTTRWLTARGHAIVDQGKTVRVVGVVSDVTARKRKSDLDRFLVEAGDVLVSTLSLDEMLRNVADMLVGSIADWCTVQLFENGNLRPTLIAHRDPERIALANRLLAEYPPEDTPSALSATAIETGRAVLLEQIPDELLSESARDETHLELLRSLGLRSAIVAPLMARGRALGLMSIVAAESGHEFGADDLRFAEDFGRRAGMAIDNAGLMEQALTAQEAARNNSARLAVIASVVAELSRAADIKSVAQAAIRTGVEALDADRGSVVLREGDASSIVAAVGYDAEALEGYQKMVEEPGPLRDAIETGEPVYCESTDALVERYPNLETKRPIGSASFAAVPLRSSTEVVGALGLVFSRTRGFDGDDQQLLAALGVHVGVAIERGRLYDEIRSVASTLQSALAPPPVENVGPVEVAARYSPAGVGGIGGDWYDIVATPRDTVAFVVGDVVGRGLDAVAAMAQLRHSIRLLLLEGRPPPEAMKSLHTLARSEPNTLAATLLCVDVDVARREATVVSAGHLPPVLVRSRSATLLETAVEPPLGVGEAYFRRRTVSLEPEDVLILITDGIVERRDEAIDRSLQLMCDWLGEARPDAETLADGLLAWSDDVSDDATVLVIRFPSGEGDARRPSPSREVAAAP